MLKNKFVSLFLFLITTFSASFIGGITTFKFKEPWYSTLVKPSFNPPDWVFGPVWTILYILMAIAIWNVWIKSKNINLVYLYFIHLFFNTTWSVVFFGFNQIELALINLIVLILFIVILFLKYKVISKLSAYLMIPYFLWCCFAFLLNLNLMVLN
jgi:benzodiazapine receptor